MAPISVNTTILISNLHCSSCVNTIRDVLTALTPPPVSIHTSIVSQSVSIEHPPQLSADAIKGALDDAGFDLVTTPQFEQQQQQHHVFRLRRSASGHVDWLARKREKHAEQCLLCHQEQQRVNESDDTIVADPSSPLSKIVDHDERPGPNSSRKGDYHHAIFAVKGPFCNSGAVTNTHDLHAAIVAAVSSVQGVSDVHVDLADDKTTASMTLERPELSDAVKNTVEEGGGYKCDVLSIEKVAGPSESREHITTSSSLQQPTQKHVGPFKATFMVGGMTCASCVGNVTHSVEDVEGISDAAVNLIGKSATATLVSRDLVSSFISAVEDGGYEAELVTIEPLAPAHPPPSKAAPAPQQGPKKQPQEPRGPYRATFSVGGMTCASCVNNVMHALSELKGVSEVAVNLVGKSATAILEERVLVPQFISAVEDGGYEAELVTIEPLIPPFVTRQKRTQESSGPFRATFSVGGMTCASCVNNVTHAVSEVKGVTDVAVNLVGKSASAILPDRDLVSVFITAVEDSGYEAELIILEPVHDSQDDEETNTEDNSGPRSVALRIDGMFCKHCPSRIAKVLESFGDKITIDEPLGAWDDPKPILRITYLPSPPSFTIRTIISALASAKSPPFIVSIARPPSLEERAKILHMREQRALLLKLASAVVLAIPTFLIGIVFMTLLPATHHLRMFFMEPMWAGNASRAEWALLFLATPAMFYSASHFHRRSIKELYGLWRPGSRTPIWKRFVRFGSMNLLVSLGVSIAYFASIALLVLAAVQPPSADGMGDSTTYFDSVVLLTMFLLAGRYLEAYSKGRTADAITALGALRPSEALLVVAPEAEVNEKELGDNADSHTLTDVGAASSDIIEHDLEKGDPKAELRQHSIGSQIQNVNVDHLEVGDLVRVPHGSTPPADGVVVSTSGTQFDESSLTGESRPIKKNEGDRVFVGTINRGTVVDVRITALGGETMLDQIVKVVREGQTKRAPIERLADVLTGVFVPFITLLAILTWIIWLALGLSGALPQDFLDIPVGGWPVWALEFAIAVFVVACPCGIGLAAPTALLVGSGLAAKFGILVRGGGEAFQEAAQLDIVVFDKTGTLTQGGEPRITNASLQGGANGGWSDEDLLSVAHTLELASSHPLGIAVRRYCEKQREYRESAVVEEGTGIEETAGRGLKGRFSSPACEAIIGNESWMTENNASLSDVQTMLLTRWKSEGKSVIVLAFSHVERSDDQDATIAQQGTNFKVVALFGASDVLRPEARGVIGALQRQGLGTWMITGDNEITARAVAKTVGIQESNVIAGVLPHQKAEKIAWLQQVGMKRDSGDGRGWVRRLKEALGLTLKPLNERAVVAMVGDGINDAPALMGADVGIAIGSGSDVAISSASFILIKSDLKSILTLTDLSSKVFRRIKFNFLWAIIYNLAALPIAAGVIYPAHRARLDPVWASLAMALSSVTVVLSSLMLRLYREPKVRID